MVCTVHQQGQSQINCIMNDIQQKGASHMTLFTCIICSNYNKETGQLKRNGGWFLTYQSQQLSSPSCRQIC